MSHKVFNKRKLESNLAILAMIAIVIAWLVGKQLENADIVSTIRAKMPEIAKLEEIGKASYKTFNEEGAFLYYLDVQSSMGYGGPLQMAVAVDTAGKIINLAVISSKETPSYLEKVLEAKFLRKLKGRSYQEEYAIDEGIDAVCSATYSSRAIVEATKKGNHFIASEYLGFDVPKEEVHSIHFGIPEIVILLLFAIGYFAHKKTFKYKKAARWGTMLMGLFVIGFFYNKAFTLSMINQLLLGYFPPLHSHLYWYLLLGGIFLVFTVDNKNPYCLWFCPFGAAQECMGLVGGAKPASVGRLRNAFKWALRTIVVIAIILALLFRNPGLTSYEVFGTLFKLTGSYYQFALLGIVLVTSIFIKRPWCAYLCPIKPLTDHYAHMRKILINKWNRKKST